MTLGSRAEFHKHLSEVEKYGFHRDFFPWSYNGHDVVLMKNDGYFAEDDRLFLQFEIYCRSCERESTYRGKLRQDTHLHDRIQTVKMLTLLPYHTHDC